MDGILRFTLLGGYMRGALVSGTSMVRAMRDAHSLGILETIALGQAYIGAALTSVTLKDGDRLSYRIDCSGPLKGLSVETTWDGRVRGYLFVDSIPLDSPPASFDLAPYIGAGNLSVARRSPGEEPFSGSVALVHGRIAEDLTEYYLRSEQTRTAFSLGVRFDSSGEVSGAGGLFLQAMPGAREVDVDDAQERMAELPSLSEWYASGKGSGDFLSAWWGAFEPDVVGNGPVVFSCECSKERLGSVLVSLGREELEAMAAEGPLPVEIVCHNCATRYLFDGPELKDLAAKL